MSKLNYLLIIFFLCVISYIVIGQLKLANRSVSQLTAAEAVEKIEIQIIKAYRVLKRFPNADNEFETLVLGKLDFSRYPGRIILKNFQPGNERMPALFQVVIKGKTTVKPLVVWMEYYGCRYRKNFLYKGKLVRK